MLYLVESSFSLSLSSALFLKNTVLIFCTLVLRLREVIVNGIMEYERCCVLHNGSEFYSYCWVYQKFITFYCWVVFHCMDIPQFVYQCPDNGHLGCLKFWLLWIKMLWTFLLQFLLYGHVFSFLLEEYLGEVFLGTKGYLCKFMFKCIRNCQTKVVITFYSSTKNVWEFRFFHIFTKIWCFQTL